VARVVLKNAIKQVVLLVGPQEGHAHWKMCFYCPQRFCEIKPGTERELDLSEKWVSNPKLLLWTSTNLIQANNCCFFLILDLEFMLFCGKLHEITVFCHCYLLGTLKVVCVYTSGEVAVTLLSII